MILFVLCVVTNVSLHFFQKENLIVFPKKKDYTEKEKEKKKKKLTMLVSF